MLGFIFGKRCAFCKKRTSHPRQYLNDDDKIIHVCEKCVLYAERRAYRKQ
ncbi:hypothetical protein [Caldalkalibacillus salinus]|nr:hypothetical protein [Caldalkalibacillus salinus]